MKVKKMTKSAISALLCVLMLLSMLTAAIITTSADEVELADTSAEVEVAEEAASQMEVYLTKPSGWNNVYIHYWGGSSSTSWPGAQMTKKYTNDYNEDVYYIVIPGNSTGIIFNNGSGTQTPNIEDIAGKAVVAYYLQGTTPKSWDTIPESTLAAPTYALTVDTTTIDVTSGAGVVTLTAGSHSYYVTKTTGSSSTQVARGAYTANEAGNYKVSFNSSNNSVTFTFSNGKTRIAIADNTPSRWIGNDAADLYVYANGAYNKLIRSVDVSSGLTTWYGDVPEISNGSQIIFLRASAIAKASQLDYNKVGSNDGVNYNIWKTNYQAGYPLYQADDSSLTASNMLTIPNGSATDFGYGIWVDTTGAGDTKNFVKIYSTDFKNDLKYYLYLPSYVNMNALQVYTNLYDLKIGGTSIARGQANTLNVGSASSMNISFKRNANTSVHNGTLYFQKTTDTAAMFLTTKEDMYTGLTKAYAVLSDDVTANTAGISAYKKKTETKKDAYLFYDESGKQLNSDTVVKKLKGRGNSSFEASMRLYGKYAYNISFDKKAGLIQGAEKSKKYCLLANNADESMMRNTLIYAMGGALGIPYSPKTRLIDLYDNGNYLGAYVIIEKVEYGSSTLIKDAVSADKMNEDILAAGKNIDYDALKQKTATYTAKSGTTYTYQYSYTTEAGKTYEYDGSSVSITDGGETESYTLDEAYMKSGDFLLEHEIEGRYQAEATWFISKRTNQAVVPKYPEFATQKQVLWMIEAYDAIESAAWSNNYSNIQNVMDVDSFAKVYLIQELTMNLDAAATSYYILGGGSFEKPIAAPLWDYDWAAGAYHGTKLTTSGSVEVSDYSKTFVKNKSVKIDKNDGRTQSIPNLQAKLTQNSGFWTECKKIYTNEFVPVLGKYLDNRFLSDKQNGTYNIADQGILLTEFLPHFRSAAAMNDSRWGLLKSLNDATKSSTPEVYWGTRSTTNYRKGGYDSSFNLSNYYCTGANLSYDNTVYYLNDWLVKRWNQMSTPTSQGGLGLWDDSLVVVPTEPPTEAPTEAPTQAPTAAPTEAPTEAPTQAPTAAPTEAPTEAPTQAPTAAPTEAPTEPLKLIGKSGDANHDGVIDIMDATVIQRVLAELEQADDIFTVLGNVDGSEGVDIADVTYIQRYIAAFEDPYAIGTTVYR